VNVAKELTLGVGFVLLVPLLIVVVGAPVVLFVRLIVEIAERML
jgi:hypothetical protein